MAWKVAKTRRTWRFWLPRWEYEIFLSSHGMTFGYAWTKRGAEKKLWDAQARMLVAS